MVSLCGKCGCAISHKPKDKRFFLAPDGKVYAKCGSCHSMNKLDQEEVTNG